MRTYNIMVVGATGLVGRTLLKVLEERKFPVGKLMLLASEKSHGQHITFGGRPYAVETLSETAFQEDMDMAFFTAGGAISEKYVPLAAEKGIVAVDNSSIFRMDPKVPLVVPEVNPEDLEEGSRIIANPNCSTIQCMLPLKVLEENYGIKRIVYSTYQSVSGSGTRGLKDLDEDRQDFYPHRIRENLLPQIDVFLEDGYTKEEKKLMEESRKILHGKDLKITATAVRVPVRYGHGVSVNVELMEDFDLTDVKRKLSAFPGMTVIESKEAGDYPTPIEAEGTDTVYVGRVRRDPSLLSGLNLWVVADNLRKGAATNAVQIAELVVKKREEER